MPVMWTETDRVSAAPRVCSCGATDADPCELLTLRRWLRVAIGAAIAGASLVSLAYGVAVWGL